MANNKKGFIFYNVDTDRYMDIRIKKLKKNFGCNGVAVYDYILAWIYREEGCFLQWDEGTVMDVAEYWNVKETMVTEIVTYCASVGLFNKELLSDEKMISSRSIVSRYQEMCIKAKRKNVKIPEFLLKLLEESSKIQELSPKLPEVSHNIDRVNKEREIENSPTVQFSDEEILKVNAEQMLIPEMLQIWRSKKPAYFSVKDVDYPSLLQIAYYIAKFKGWKQNTIIDKNKDELLKSWNTITDFIIKDPWYKEKDLTYFSTEKNWSGLVNKMIEKNNPQLNGKSKQQIDHERQITEERTAQLAKEN